MFTWKRKWKFSVPLKYDNDIIEMKSSTKFLGVTLDSKLTRNEQITNQCNKAKGILMQCRKAVGPTWGFTPKTMKYNYTAVVRPSLSYGAVIWINGLKTAYSVQRLANILISGALPSSPGNALNKINDIIPIDNSIEEEALKGTLRLKANGHWIRTPMVNSRGNLDRILNTIPLSKEDQDSMTTTYNLDPKFVVGIPIKEDYKEVEPINFNINCHTDGSKINDNRTGAGVIINYSHHDS